jgi:hypothetical protein
MTVVGCGWWVLFIPPWWDGGTNFQAPLPLRLPPKKYLSVARKKTVLLHFRGHFEVKLGLFGGFKIFGEWETLLDRE